MAKTPDSTNPFAQTMLTVCPHDSDSDGDCHFCHSQGGCREISALQLFQLGCSLGYERGSDDAVSELTSMKDLQAHLRDAMAPKWVEPLLHEFNAQAPSHAEPIPGFIKFIVAKLEAATQPTFIGVDMADPATPDMTRIRCPYCPVVFLANSQEYADHIKDEHTVVQYDRQWFYDNSSVLSDKTQQTPAMLRDLAILAGTPRSHAEEMFFD